MRRTFLKTLASLGVLAGLIGGGLFFAVQYGQAQSDNSEESRIQIGFKIAPVPLNLKGKNRGLVGLGSYIVNSQGDCNGCHSKGPQSEFLFGGIPYFGQHPTQVNPDVYLGASPRGSLALMRASQARASRRLLNTLTGRSPCVAAKARDGSTTHVSIPEIAASKVSLIRGKRKYAFPKLISVKLAADVASGEKIDKIDVKQLDGDLGGLATLAMPAPISITNRSAPTPSANGKIALTGALAPLMQMLSVVQDADPMPYAGDYAVAQNVATDPNVTGDPGKNLDTAKIPEERPLAFNIDGRQEGDFNRISEDQLRDALADGLVKGASKTPPGEAREYVQGKNWFVFNALDSQANEALQNQTWSDYSWVLLAFVALLLLEQFLAMKFSHHVA